MFDFKKEKKPASKPKPSQPAKTTERQEVKPSQKKQPKNKQIKKIEHSANPYQRFLDSNISANIEDLTRFFELRTSRFNSRGIVFAALGLSLFSVLVTAYYKAIEQGINIDSLPIGNVVPIVFIGAAIALIAITTKSIVTMSDTNFDKNFKWYLDAKNHFRTQKQTQVSEGEEELTPGPTRVQKKDVEELEISDEESTLSDTEA